MSTFRFPLAREERTLLLAGSVCAVALLIGLMLALGQLAVSAERSLGSIVSESVALRAAVAGAMLVTLIHAYVVWSFIHVHAGTRIEVGDAIRFQRPGWPLVGWCGRDLMLKAANVDLLQLERRRRGMLSRVRLRVGAGREEVALNLDQCVPEGGAPRSLFGPRPDDQNLSQEPLVCALVSVTGVPTEVV